MELILALLIVLAAVAGLAIGLILKDRPLRASCGGAVCNGACATCPRRASKEAGPDG